MSENATSFWSTPKGLAALGLIGAATYFLLMEHRQHVWQYLPFIILLACPFMHVFMHGGHGGHSGHRAPVGSETTDSSDRLDQGSAKERRNNSESDYKH